MQHSRDSVRVAAIQASPVFLDRDQSLEKAVQLVRQAAARGAVLAAFGESWLPGYPIHVLTAPGSQLWLDMAADYLDRAIEIPGPETDVLCQAAREAGIDILIGVAERDPVTRGSVYATQLFVGADGAILGRHRKLKPAPHERAVWADGDGVDLKVHDRDYARVSGLNGCEHQMVLPTYALAEQGTQIHVASWPGREPRAAVAASAFAPRQHLLARAFAVQTGAYVLCVGGTLTADAVPEKYRSCLDEDLTGDSMIVDPRGDIIAGPVGGENILLADCSLAQVRLAKVAFDCAGHSSRRDQIKLWTPANETAENGDTPDGPGPMFDDDADAVPPMRSR